MKDNKQLVSEIERIMGENNKAREEINNYLTQVNNVLGQILIHLNPQDSEEDVLVRGDEVICESDNYRCKGIYLGEGIDCYWVLVYGDEVPQKITKELWLLIKTGKHVDLGEED